MEVCAGICPGIHSVICVGIREIVLELVRHVVREFVREVHYKATPISFHLGLHSHLSGDNVCQAGVCLPSTPPLSGLPKHSKTARGVSLADEQGEGRSAPHPARSGRRVGGAVRGRAWGVPWRRAGGVSCDGGWKLGGGGWSIRFLSN